MLSIPFAPKRAQVAMQSSSVILRRKYSSWKLYRLTPRLMPVPVALGCAAMSLTLSGKLPRIRGYVLIGGNPRFPNERGRRTLAGPNVYRVAGLSPRGGWAALKKSPRAADATRGPCEDP